MISGFEAFGWGFAYFFSIWQSCIAQISPFFMAYIIGLYFMAYQRETPPPSIARRTVVPSLVYMVGFSVPFALFNATGLQIGRQMAYHSGTLSFAAGVIILLIVLFMVLHGRVERITRLDVPLHTALMSLLLGIAFAFAYSPCITPALSRIMNIGSQADTAVTGAFLALWYGLGMSLAFLAVGTALVVLFSRIGALTRNPGRVKDVSAAILFILAFFNISGLMTLYKAFILGFFVN